MSSSRLVRGTKARMFAFVCLVCVLAAVLYVFHGTQVRLADVQKQLVGCTQQKESFHAQLQVIFEYKERLEKSLNKEKVDHKQTRESLERRLKEEKERLESDYTSKSDVLQQKNNDLQGQLEELKDANEKLTDAKTRLSLSLDMIKKELETLRIKNDDTIEGMKTDWLKKEEEVQELKKQIEDYKLKMLPETDRNNYLEKQNFQMKEENDKMKKDLSECKEREKKPAVHPSPVANGKSNKAAEEDANILRVGPLLKSFSSTPGINPDALLGASSAKPVKDDASRKDEQAAVASMPKKPTQESVIPLVQPRKVDDTLAMGQGQIPQPPNPPNPLSNILQKPNVVEDPPEANINLPEDSEDNMIKQQQAKAQLQEPNLFLVDANRAEEEEEQVAQFKQPAKNQNYRGGDYDKEQQEEEDEEGELIDDEGDRVKDGKRVRIPPQVGLMQQRNGGGGVMVNPK
ncbi:Golgi integral membrane protein 4-like [Cimex lectularius]|uniref:Golgi integral membrane protein 4 n=1 Tax=Cimex lectularius TaxID=79782 RepID=A0A8I6RGR7_CIMLE|nr:Golgi integral membrane protein 4-like [Cimex lectularius]